MVRRTLKLAAAGAASVVVVVAAAAGWWAWQTAAAIDNIPRIDVSDQLRSDHTPPDPAPAQTPEQPTTNILVVGSDGTERLPDGDPRKEGRTASSRLADTIMVVQLKPPEAPHLISIPRDLWVTLAHSDQPGKLNWALSQGGPESLIATVTAQLGYPIDHYVEVDFGGFLAAFALLGDVDINLSHAAKDSNTGLDIPAGCVAVDGDTALALVRSRYLSYNVDGIWVDDPSGDLGRVDRQQQFVVAATAKLSDLSYRTPAQIGSLAAQARDFATLSTSLDRRTLMGLASSLRELPPPTTEVIGGQPGWAGDHWVLFPSNHSPTSTNPQHESPTPPPAGPEGVPALTITPCA